MKTSKQIKHQFTGYYMLLICCAVILFESLIIGYSGHFYQNQMKEQLSHAADALSKRMEQHLEQATLSQQIAADPSLLLRSGVSLVQLYDPSGILLSDTSGTWQAYPVNEATLKRVMLGEVIYETIQSEQGERYLTLWLPIKHQGAVAGLLRVISPLSGVNEQIKDMALYFLAIGLAVIVVTGLGAYVLANTVTSPIQKLIGATRRMASGDMSELPTAIYPDEVGELAESIAFFGSEIQRREMEKNAMFSSVSHELRTPLTAIRGWAETLADPAYENDGSVIHEGLETIKQESLRLSQLVEELLDYTRLSNGQMGFCFEQSDLVDVVLTTVSALKPKASQKGIQLTANISEATYEDMTLSQMRIDGNRMKQLCMNLIDNSLKFTPKGGRVSIDLERFNDMAHIRVSDTGCGIAPELLPKVKERFVKGTHSESHLGLGLAICEAVVKAHKGDWVIHSVLGEGTVIEVSIPLNLEGDGLTPLQEMGTLKAESVNVAAKRR